MHARVLPTILFASLCLIPAAQATADPPPLDDSAGYPITIYRGITPVCASVLPPWVAVGVECAGFRVTAEWDEQEQAYRIKVCASGALSKCHSILAKVQNGVQFQILIDDERKLVGI